MVERNFMLFLPHEAVRLGVALRRADGLAQCDPGVVERVLASEAEPSADWALEKLDSGFSWYAAEQGLLQHAWYSFPLPLVYGPYAKVPCA